MHDFYPDICLKTLPWMFMRIVHMAIRITYCILCMVDISICKSFLYWLESMEMKSSLFLLSFFFHYSSAWLALHVQASVYAINLFVMWLGVREDLQVIRHLFALEKNNCICHTFAFCNKSLIFKSFFPEIATGFQLIVVLSLVADLSVKASKRYSLLGLTPPK